MKPSMQRLCFSVLAWVILGVGSTPLAVLAQEGTDDYRVYFPLAYRMIDACQPIQGVVYRQISVVADSRYARPPGLAPEDDRELNIYLRGYSLTEDYAGLWWYGGPTDYKAPQLYTLFADERTSVFSRLYRVDEERKIWPVTMSGFEVTPGEIIRVPDSGYDIGNGKDVMVLYASRSQITLKYTREDNVVFGYTVHIEGICTEPSLQALYDELNAAGRGSLPALTGKQPLGRAWGNEIRVVIRDTGSFMDPRSCKDWWWGRCVPPDWWDGTGTMGVPALSLP